MKATRKQFGKSQHRNPHANTAFDCYVLKTTMAADATAAAAAATAAAITATTHYH